MVLSEKLERLGAISSKQLAGEPTELSKRLYECADEAKALEQGIPTIKKMNLAEGDVLVLKFAGMLSCVRKDGIIENMKRVIPDNDVILIDQCADIEILSKGEND